MRESINLEATMMKLYEATFWLHPWTKGELGTSYARLAHEHIEKAIEQVEIIIKAQDGGWQE